MSGLMYASGLVSSSDLTPCVKRSRDRIMVKSPMVIITVKAPASQPMAATGCTQSCAAPGNMPYCTSAISQL